jgi:hypothetical protein
MWYVLFVLLDPVSNRAEPVMAHGWLHVLPPDVAGTDPREARGGDRDAGSPARGPRPQVGSCLQRPRRALYAHSDHWDVSSLQLQCPPGGRQ